MMCTIAYTTVLCDYIVLSCINIFTQDKADLEIYKIDIDLEIRASEQKHVNKTTKTIQWLKYFVSTKILCQRIRPGHHIFLQRKFLLLEPGKKYVEWSRKQRIESTCFENLKSLWNIT